MQNEFLKAISRESECGPIPLKSKYVKKFSYSNSALGKYNLTKDRKSMPGPRELSATKMGNYCIPAAETKNVIRFRFDLELNRAKMTEKCKPLMAKEYFLDAW
jgi:hypothetical protein